MPPACCTASQERTRREKIWRERLSKACCGLADGLEAIIAAGVPVSRVLLIGGGAQSEAVRQIAPAVFGVPVDVPASGEYVANGAARQAAWLLAAGDEPPAWTLSARRYEVDPAPEVRQRYAGVRNRAGNVMALAREGASGSAGRT